MAMGKSNTNKSLCKIISLCISLSWMITRTNLLHRHYRDYFPVELVKTAELPATKNYILASFPHGILG